MSTSAPWSPSQRIGAMARAILVVIVALMAVAPLVVDDPKLFWLFYLPHLAGACGTLIALRFGRPRLALTLGVGLSFLGLSNELYYWGGVTAHDVVGFPVLVAIVGVLWNVRAAVVTAICCGVSLTAAALVEHAGRMPPPISDTPLFQALLGSYGALGVTAVVMVLANRLLDAAIRNTQAAHARFAALVHQSPDALVFMDREGRVEFMNDAAVRLCGYEREEILGLRLDELPFFPAPFRKIAMDTYQELVRTGIEAPPRETPLVHRSGRELAVEVNRRRVELPDGRVGMQYTIRDVSERRRGEALRAQLQTRLQEAQRLETIGQLAGGVAHDFNNLLTVILGQGELLLYAPLRDKEREQVRQILKAGDRARALTQQLLAYARRQHIQPRSIDPCAAVRELLPLLQTLVGKRGDIVLDLDDAGARIRVDPGQFDQVLTNLVSNARDALAAHGTITIGVHRIDRPATAPDGGATTHASCRICVSDDGHGMTEDVLARIFEPFFTTKLPAQGTGLGLAVVEGIVSQNGGHIQVHSEPGRGTRFTIEFPCAEGEPLALPTATPALIAPGRPARVLLVEDEPAVRDTTERLLLTLGYRVVPAGSAAEALAEHAERGPFDLVMTDVVMPGGTGLDLADALRARGSGAPVIFMSGYLRDDVPADLPPGSRFLRKPFTAQALAEQIESLLRQPAS